MKFTSFVNFACAFEAVNKSKGTIWSKSALIIQLHIFLLISRVLKFELWSLVWEIGKTGVSNSSLMACLTSYTTAGFIYFDEQCSQVWAVLPCLCHPSVHLPSLVTHPFHYYALLCKSDALGFLLYVSFKQIAYVCFPSRKQQ